MTDSEREALGPHEAHDQPTPVPFASQLARVARVWELPDGTLVVLDEDERYGSDVMWIEDIDLLPATAVPLVPRQLPLVGSAGGGATEPDEPIYDQVRAEIGPQISEENA